MAYGCQMFVFWARYTFNNVVLFCWNYEFVVNQCNEMQCSKSFDNTSMPNNYKHTAELLRQLVVGHFEHPESENWALTTFHLPPVPFFDGISFSRKKHVMKQNVLGDIRLWATSKLVLSWNFEFPFISCTILLCWTNCDHRFVVCHPECCPGAQHWIRFLCGGC